MNTIWGYFFPRKVSDAEKTIELLEKTPIFEGLSKRKLQKLLRVLHKRFYKEGETVFRVGEPGIGMYVICEGEVSVSIGIREEEQEIASLQKGQTFGDLALIKDHLRSATVVATKPTHLLGLIRSEFMDLLSRDPSLGVDVLLRLLNMVGERLIRTNEQFVETQVALKLLENTLKVDMEMAKFVRGDARPLDEMQPE